MRILIAGIASLPILFSCVGNSGSSSGTDTCPASDDAGAYEGTLFTLADGGDLTVDLDAGNGGIAIAPSSIAGQVIQTYEWPCITTFDCQSPRDASITFSSPNGVSGWTVQSMAFDTGASCVAAVVDAGSVNNCCNYCYAAQSEQPCQDTCISSFSSCATGPGCACQM